jgi:hypothetical protein
MTANIINAVNNCIHRVNSIDERMQNIESKLDFMNDRLNLFFNIIRRIESNLTGIKGPDGNPGQQGSKGPIGDEGPRGIRGLEGPRGPQGLPGPVGPRGHQGEKGEKGDKGESGQNIQLFKKSGKIADAGILKKIVNEPRKEKIEPIKTIVEMDSDINQDELENSLTDINIITTPKPQHNNFKNNLDNHLDNHLDNDLNNHLNNDLNNNNTCESELQQIQNELCMLEKAIKPTYNTNIIDSQLEDSYGIQLNNIELNDTTKLTSDMPICDANIVNTETNDMDLCEFENFISPESKQQISSYIIPQMSTENESDLDLASELASFISGNTDNTTTYDNTITDTVNDTITNTVNDTVNDTVIDTVTDTVIDTVIDTITDTVTDTITDTVTDTINDIVTVDNTINEGNDEDDWGIEFEDFLDETKNKDGSIELIDLDKLMDLNMPSNLSITIKKKENVRYKNKIDESNPRVQLMKNILENETKQIDNRRKQEEHSNNLNKLLSIND